MKSVLEQLLETWRTNNRINLFLIDYISDEGMKCTLSKRGGRNVVRQFAHVHNQRVYHLDGRTKGLSKGLKKFPSSEEPDKVKLKKYLVESSEKIVIYIEQSMAGSSKHRPFKKGIISTVGYFIAHESHHRGSILLTLKECGHKLDQKVQSAIWNWDKM